MAVAVRAAAKAGGVKANRANPITKVVVVKVAAKAGGVKASKEASPTTKAVVSRPARLNCSI